MKPTTQELLTKHGLLVILSLWEFHTMGTRIFNTLLFVALYLICWFSTHTVYCKPLFISSSVLSLPSLCVLRTRLYVKDNYSSLTRVADGHDHGTRRRLNLVINTTCSIAPNTVLNMGATPLSTLPSIKYWKKKYRRKKYQESTGRSTRIFC